MVESMYAGQYSAPTSDATIAIYTEKHGKQKIESLSWIRDEIAEGLKRFSKFYVQCKEADTFYNGEFDFDVPEGGTML